MIRKDIRLKNFNEMKKHNIPYIETLPFIEEFPEKLWKNGYEIGKRLIVSYALVGLANDADPAKLLDWLKEEKVDDALLDSEKCYFSKNTLNDKDVIHLSWYQEALYALAWCIGVQSELAFPDTEADIQPLFAKIPPEIEAESFLSELVRRPKEQILTQADLYYCYHWAVKHKGESSKPVKIHRSVVMERRRALDWVIGCGDSYDLIPLDT